MDKYIIHIAAAVFISLLVSFSFNTLNADRHEKIVFAKTGK